MNDFELEEKTIIDYIKKYKVYLLFMILIIIIFILGLFLINNNVKANNKKTKTIIRKVTVKETQKKNYKVDIKGEILNPGVYELEENSRIIDVINKAGGLLENSDTTYINLSKKIKDEMVIIIYNEEYIKKYKDKKEEPEYIYIENECDCPDDMNEACTIQKEEEKEELGKKLLSINKASVDELTTLPGIGKSKAENIIKYREENGDFKTIEDIKNVNGIGDNLLEKIKDSITI